MIISSISFNIHHQFAFKIFSYSSLEVSVKTFPFFSCFMHKQHLHQNKLETHFCFLHQTSHTVEVDDALNEIWKHKFPPIIPCNIFYLIKLIKYSINTWLIFTSDTAKLYLFILKFCKHQTRWKIAWKWGKKSTLWSLGL